MNCLLAILQCIFYTGNAAVPVLNFVETHCKHDLGSLITQVSKKCFRIANTDVFLDDCCCETRVKKNLRK